MLTLPSRRYTDFLVNEILPSGEVLHLRNLKAPKPVKQQKQGNRFDAKQARKPEESPVTENNEEMGKEAKSLRLEVAQDDKAPMGANEDSAAADGIGSSKSKFDVRLSSIL